MAKFRDYTRFAASYCPNLPAIVFERAMLTASRLYFTKTQAWNDEYEVELKAGVAKYVTPLPYQFALIDTITSAEIDGAPLDAQVGTFGKEKTGTPRAFITPNKDTLVLSHAPKEDGTLLIKYSLKPSIDTKELPDILFDEHFEGLIAGCVFEVKRMPGTEWFDPQGANNFLAEFHSFIDNKRIELLKGDNNAELVIDYSMGNY